MAHRREPAPRGPLSRLGDAQLFESVRDAVVVADASGRVVLWNPAAERVFGYAADEAQGMDVRALVPDALRARHDAGMQRFRETGRGAYIESGSVLELPAMRKDGSEIVVEMTLSRLDDDALHTMAIVRDVTERVRQREAAEADRRRLRAANESLEAFSYIVGHDLKEPVRAVDAYLEAVADGPLGGAQRDALTRAQNANARMAALLEGLLDWSRATVGGLEPEPIDIQALVTGDPCSARYQRVLRERGGTLSFVGDFGRVMGTESLLCQIFGNLVLNALRHNPSPNPTVDVVALGAHDGLLEIAVRDNGPGFPPHMRQGAADLQRLTPARGGFGLAIAARAAGLLGGRLSIGDAPGGGASVHVWLPHA